MDNFEALKNTLKENGILGYQQKHFEICNRLWREYIPDRGQCTCVQGEMLREIEKLRYEAFQNGNVNWCETFSWFCDNVYSILESGSMFDAQRLGLLRAALDFLKVCGETKRVHTQDDVYDYIEDGIAEYAKAIPDPVPFNPTRTLDR
ncbi:MAG: hypothetical protein IK130_09710 [Oscillospiraceae bacterium]|nr:hypothetical protein [Oscillospiraceae bacterium]